MLSHQPNLVRSIFRSGFLGGIDVHIEKHFFPKYFNEKNFARASKRSDLYYGLFTFFSVCLQFSESSFSLATIALPVTFEFCLRALALL